MAPLAAWIRPIFFLRCARDHRSTRGYLLLFAAYILAFLIGFGTIWLSNWGILMMSGLAVLYGLLWSLPYLADPLLCIRLGGFSSTFVYPLAATSLEFLNIHTNPVGIWGATGFTQYGNLPLMQLASVTGMIGITFLMGWFAAVFNWAWENRGRGPEVFRGLGIFGTVFTLVFTFGFLRLNLAPMSETGETIRVAGITARGLDSASEKTSEDSEVEDIRLVFQAHHDAYFNETVRKARAGARIILWPEISDPTFDSDEAALVVRAREVARQNGIYLAMPVLTIDSEDNR